MLENYKDKQITSESYVTKVPNEGVEKIKKRKKKRKTEEEITEKEEQVVAEEKPRVKKFFIRGYGTVMAHNIQDAIEIVKNYKSNNK